MMQNKKIAITGGIGSGKTTVCEILKVKGYAVFSCDEISKQLRKEKEYIKALSEAIPECVSDGKISETLLSQIVFSDKRAKVKLEAISHPLIMKRLFAEMKNYPVSFAEVPLLFEGGFETLFDAVVAVVREKEKRVYSVINRSNLSRGQVMKRIESQFDYSCLAVKHCTVIENNGSFADLERKVEEFLLQKGL